MKKSIFLNFLFVSLIFISISCGNDNQQNPVTHQLKNDTDVKNKLLGMWQLIDPSGDPDKNITYLFDDNKICFVYKGNEKPDINKNNMSYEVIQKFNSNLVLIKDAKRNSTLFTINSIDDSKMRVVFMVINNKKIKDKVEVELSKAPVNNL
jgi:hypothetical protein